MKIISFNLRADADRWPERLPMIVDVLHNLQADIIGLQEVRLNIQQAHLLADALNRQMPDYPYSVYLCEDWYEPNILANGFLARVPVLAHERIKLPEGFRTAQRIQVMLNDVEINIANTHLHHKPYRDERIREPQMQTIVDWLVPLNTPLVLMGDMNARPDSSTIALAKTHFASAYETFHGAEPATTFPTPLRTDKVLADRTIDYIFVRGLSVTSARIIANQPHPDDDTLYPSDHFGLLAGIE